MMLNLDFYFLRVPLCWRCLCLMLTFITKFTDFLSNGQPQIKQLCVSTFYLLLILWEDIYGYEGWLLPSGHLPVSHLPLGSFPSARNRAQIWWVPAMAIHSTLSSTPPMHTRTHTHTNALYDLRNKKLVWLLLVVFTLDIIQKWC